jgi:hypothetical protein
MKVEQKFTGKIINGIKHLALPEAERTLCDRHAMTEGTSAGWITQECYSCHTKAGIR